MTFSDKGIFDAELRDHCLKLNELLNDVKIQDYDLQLKENKEKIRNVIEKLNRLVREPQIW